jgi:hypothetical protein
MRRELSKAVAYGLGAALLIAALAFAWWRSA